MSMTNGEYVTAYETISAGLGLLREMAKRAGLPVTVADLIYHVESRITDEIPPFPAELPEVPSTWSEVHPGDHVQAPNGEWYKVDAWSRTGEAVKVLLIVGGATVPTTQPAGVKVMVRRTSAEGRARDMFAAAGIELERI